MKILEAQSATLTNYEVYTHLTEQRARYARKENKGRRPGNLETVVKEVSSWRESTWNFAADAAHSYLPTSKNLHLPLHPSLSPTMNEPSGRFSNDCAVGISQKPKFS